MNWLAQTMALAEQRLEIATTNLANAHTSGYAVKQLDAWYSARGLHLAQTQQTAVHRNAQPQTNSAQQMVAILEAQRQCETAQKCVLALDGVRAKESSELARSAT